MATATVAENTFRVTIEDSVKARVKYLQVLVAKIKSATAKSVKYAVSFLRRAWDVVRSNARSATVGATAALMTSTKDGYKAITGVVKKALSFVTKNFGKLVRAVHNAIDTVGYTVANYVGMVSPKAGRALQKVNLKFTDARWTAIQYVQKRSNVFTAILQQAYNSDLTAKLVAGFSTIIATAMIIPSLGASLAALPIVGSGIAFAASGGINTIMSISAVATTGAVLSFGNTSLKPVLKAKAAPVVEAIKSKVATTRYNNDDTVIVEGAENEEEAIQLANAHIEEDIKLLEGLVKHGRGKR